MHKYWWVRWVPIWIFSLLLGWWMGGQLFAQEDVSQQEPPPATEQKVTDPKFVVIYDYQMRNKTLLNLRVVTSARSEQDAIVKATIFLNEQFRNVLNLDLLKFVEVGPMREEKEDKDKSDKKK